MEALGRGAGRLLDLVYPPRAECMGCGSKVGMERDWLCEDCRQALAGYWVGPMPPSDGRFDGAAAAYRYGGPAEGLVRNLKYRGVKALAGEMGARIVLALEPLMPLNADGVVAVPMHPKRRAERGFNHAELLARAVAEGLELPLLDVLLRTRNTPQQARLDDKQRRRNLEGAIALSGDVAGLRLVLVDDVCTTGATATACAKALLEGGAVGVCLATFAAAGKGKQKR